MKTIVFIKTILPLIIIIISLIPISTSKPIVEKIYTTDIYTLAIDEHGRGFVIKVVFNAYYPGRGLVIVSNKSRISEDTLLSIEYSIIYASIITGVDYRIYDYEFIFPENIRIRGLSGTLAFFLTLLSFYRGLKPSVKIGVTGVVYPNFLIGIVEGLTEKYNAGLSYGLDKIIGPYEASLLNRSNYYPVPDIINAYLYFTDHDLFNDTIVSSRETYIEYYDILNKVFKDSSRNWSILINNLLNMMNETIDLKEYYETEAYRLLELFNKYSNISKWYTASTYGFRAYYETLAFYLNKLLELNKTELLRNILSEIEIEIINKIQELEVLLRNYSRRVIDLWDLDAYLNSYIRFYISIKLLNESKSPFLSINERLKAYSVALSRAYTAITWLKIIDYKTNGNFYLIDWKTYRFSIDILKNFLEKTLNYLYYINLIENTTRNEFLKIIRDTGRKDLDTLVNYVLVLFDINTMLLRLSSNIFTNIIDYRVLDYLNKTMDSIMKHIYRETQVVIPSILTTLELSSSYMVENTSYTIIFSLYLNEFTLLLPIILLIHIDNILEYTYTREQCIVTSRELEYNRISYERSTYLITIVVAVIGSYMLGYIIGRLSKRLTKEIK